MFRFFALCFGMLVRFFRGRPSLLLANLALRQQLVALKRRHPRASRVSGSYNRRAGAADAVKKAVKIK